MAALVMRAEIIARARDWIDTPYQHQASVKHAGCDCLGLIRGLYRELYGREPEAPPPYTPDWAERRGAETLMAAADRHLQRHDGAPKPGDVLLFRMRADVPCKHVGVMASADTLIHAYWGRAVVESWLDPFWRRRIAHTYRFPELPK